MWSSSSGTLVDYARDSDASTALGYLLDPNHI